MLYYLLINTCRFAKSIKNSLKKLKKNSILQCAIHPTVETRGLSCTTIVNPDAWGVQSKISIEVPIKDFEDMTFRFVNNDSVITENNIPINKYNFKIENVKGLGYDRILEILTGNDEKLKNYLLSDFFADIPSIAEWFFNKVDYNF